MHMFFVCLFVCVCVCVCVCSFSDSHVLYVHLRREDKI